MPLEQHESLIVLFFHCLPTGPKRKDYQIPMSHDDRRRDFRADLRTVVNVYTPESRSANPPTYLRAWSEDISVTGARIITHDTITCPKIWLKFIAQGQTESVIEAEVVRSGLFARSHFRSGDTLNAYGVRFIRLMSDQEFMEMALDQIEHLTQHVPRETTPVSAMSVR